MKVVTKRVAIAAGALAAAGLYGSLPYSGSLMAQSGAPVQHHDVALVDHSDTVVSSEIAIDDTAYNNLLGPSGLEDRIYETAVNAFGATHADALLGTTAVAGADGIFDGAATNFASGALLDIWAGENQIDGLLGISSTVSETAILTDINADLGIPLADLPQVGSAAFDADLMSLAGADFSAGMSDFSTYVSDFGGLVGLLGDLGGGDLSGLLGTILGDLGLGGLSL